MSSYQLMNVIAAFINFVHAGSFRHVLRKPSFKICIISVEFYIVDTDIINFSTVLFPQTKKLQNHDGKALKDEKLREEMSL